VRQELSIKKSGRVSGQLTRIAKSATLDFAIVEAAYFVVLTGHLISNESGNSPAFSFSLVSAVALLLSLYLWGCYHRLWSRTSAHGITAIVEAVSIATIVLVPFEAVVLPSSLSAGDVIVANTLALGGFTAVRYRKRLISGLAWRWRAIWHHDFPDPTTRVLIVGAGAAGQTLAWQMKLRTQRRNLNFKVVGFVDDDLSKQGMLVENSPVLGTPADIPVLADALCIDLLAVAIHNISGPALRRILSFCESTSARIKLVPDVLAMIGSNSGDRLLRDIQPEDLLGRKSIGRHESVDLAPVTGKVVLVTGAAGSIGSELSRQLLSYDPVQLVLLDNNESGLYDLVLELRDMALPNVLVPALVDITDRRALDRLYSRYRPNVVFHSAAYKHVPMLEDYPEESIRVNVGGTRNVAELASAYAVERFVLISSDKAVNPVNIMGASKRVCELLVQTLSQQPENRTLFTAVRFGNVLGSRGSVVPTFERQIENGGPVTVTAKDMTRYFITISEAVNLVIHAACLTRGGDLFMLNMGDEVRIVELAERMIRLRGLRPYKDIEIRFTGVRPGEKLHEQLSTTSETVIPTCHPDILELQDHARALPATGFVARLNSLLKDCLENGADVRTTLFAAIAAPEADAAPEAASQAEAGAWPKPHGLGTPVLAMDRSISEHPRKGNGSRLRLNPQYPVWSQNAYEGTSRMGD
jgi:FlaA1/EpsC-like NDP-sugar epimerase